jgi:hypothetical protein
MYKYNYKDVVKYGGCIVDWSNHPSSSGKKQPDKSKDYNNSKCKNVVILSNKNHDHLVRVVRNRLGRGLEDKANPIQDYTYCRKLKSVARAIYFGYHSKHGIQTLKSTIDTSSRRRSRRRENDFNKSGKKPSDSQEALVACTLLAKVGPLSRLVNNI